MPTRFVNTGQPVNRSHPLNRGLLHWWHPLPHNQGGGVLYDIAGSNHATKGGTGTTWSSSSISGNAAKSITGWSGTSYYQFSTVSISSDYTVLFWGSPDTSSATFSPGITGTAITHSGLSSYHNRYLYVVPYTTTAAYIDFAAAIITSNKWQQFSFSVQSGVGSVGGVNTTFLNGPARSGTTNFSRIGASTGSHYYHGPLASAKIFNRALSAQEVAFHYYESLAGYPNLLNWIEPRAWSFGSAVQGGGGSSFQPAWARGSNIILGAGS